MLVRALAQVHRGQMKTEHLDRADQWVQALRCQCRAMVGQQRGFDGAQVGAKILGVQVRVLRRYRMPCRLAAGEAFKGGGETGIDAGQRPPVGLVLAVFVGVGRAFGQRAHVGRKIDEQGRYRQLAAQKMHFGQVVAQRHLGLPLECVLQGLRADVRVAVAVAAYPLAHTQKAVDMAAAKLALQIGVEPGNFAQERGFVVTQRVFDFVGHRELGETQQPGLP